MVTIFVNHFYSKTKLSLFIFKILACFFPKKISYSNYSCFSISYYFIYSFIYGAPSITNSMNIKIFACKLFTCVHLLYLYILCKLLKLNIITLTIEYMMKSPVVRNTYRGVIRNVHKSDPKCP